MVIHKIEILQVFIFYLRSQCHEHLRMYNVSSEFVIEFLV